MFLSISVKTSNFARNISLWSCLWSNINGKISLFTIQRYLLAGYCRQSRLIEEWEHLHQVFIDEAIMQWRPRLRACISRLGHMENILNTDFSYYLMFAHT